MPRLRSATKCVECRGPIATGADRVEREVPAGLNMNRIHRMVRVSWHPNEDGPLSMLDIQLKPEADGTCIDLYHEGRGIAGDPRGDHQHWQEALGRLAGGIPG